MVKREEADSGLRAGFMTEEEALRQQMQQEVEMPPEEEIEETPVEDEEKVQAASNDPALELKPLEGPGSTVEMKGISGKNITGVIKVIKKSKDKPADSKDEAEKDLAKTKPLEDKAEKDIAPAVSEELASVSDSVEAVSKAEAEAVTTSSVEEPKPKQKTAAVKSETEKEIAQAAPAKKTAPVKKTAEKTASEQVESKEAEVAAKQTPAATAEKKEDKPKVKEDTVVASQKKEDKKPEKVTAKNTQTSEDTKAVEHFEEAARIAEMSRPLTQQGQEVVVKTPTPPKKKEAEVAKAKPRIRPQQGSYVGKDADRPVVERRQAPPADRRQAPPADRRQAPPADRRQPQRGRSAPQTDRGQQQDRRGGDRTRPQPGRTDSRPAARTTPDRGRPGQRPPVEAAKPEILEKDLSRKTYAQKQKSQDRDKHRADREREQQRERQEALRLERKQRLESKAERQRKAAQVSKVVLPESLTVKELAEALKKTTADVIMKLMQLGVMATINQEIDFDTATIIAGEFDVETEKLVVVSEEDILFDDKPDKEEDLEPRPPVVVVMGHVDHGKTSILDYIRNTTVTSGEAGGITQHIGAYTVDLHGRKITFLDTPGHEAFTTMRARGALVTDIAVLVVAADDGVMPQTVEAINHARAANTEIIVAINKIDRPQANIDRVKTELAQYNIMDADWGGENSIIPVSALTGKNMDELLETILITADIMELKANPNRQAKGTVIEAELDAGRGPVATVLIQRGTLHIGDAIVVGSNMGHVRMMRNDRGEQVSEAGPSMPVEILGLSEVPEGGDILYQVKDEKVARALAERRQDEDRASRLRASSHMSLDTLFSKMDEGVKIDLNFIVKGDVKGSVEAVRQSLEGLSTDKIQVHVIHSATGGINESDIRLAEAADAIIVGFNVRPSAVARDQAVTAEVDIRLYSVIYEMIDEIEQAMKGMLAPEYKEVITGHAEVREIFKITGVGTVAGSYMTSGKANRNNKVRVVRDGVVIYDGELASLKRFKDDVREVAQGYEFGAGVERFNDVKVGDELEFYTMKEIENV
ncbi:MAG: translation initiation factor IF-2 [Eubacteriales bacterium]|nr:translation initiation factor IF-2 [Eubacteriales bacterium]